MAATIPLTGRSDARGGSCSSADITVTLVISIVLTSVQER